MTLTDLVAAISAHNYLALFLMLALYAKKLSGPDSKFPLEIPPNWQPTVTASFGLVYGILAAKAGGASVFEALLGGAVAAGSSGFLDGLLTAIFNHGNAPNWAKAIVFIFDDVAGSGGAGGSGTTGGTPVATTPPVNTPATPLPPPPAATRKWALTPPMRRAQRAWLQSLNVIAFVLLTAACAASSGCSLLKSPQLPADLQAVEQCVYINVVQKGVTDPQQLIAACSQFEAQLVIDAAQALASSKGLNSITAAKLNRQLAAFRDDVGVCR